MDTKTKRRKKTLANIPQEILICVIMNREELIKWIKKNDKSYSNIKFLTYSDDELLLLKIYIGLEKEKHTKNGREKIHGRKTGNDLRKR